MQIITRLKENPLLSANEHNEFEADSTFNASPSSDNKQIHLTYRAVSTPKTVEGNELKVSSIGYANSKDGINFKDRKQLIAPDKEWDRFGCEDPRITKINNKYFIFYTALSAFPFKPKGIKVGLGITKDFKHVEKHPVTTFNSKAMTLFPEKIKGKFAALLSVNTDNPPARNCVAFFDKEEDIYSPAYWNKWYYSFHKNIIPLERGSKNLAEIGTSPIKTQYGWLIIYANVRNYHSSNPNLFGIEAALLDLKDPRKIIGIIDDPLLTPREDYEINGKIPNIVFPSGAFLQGDDLYLYYSGADTVVCGAKISFNKLIKKLQKNSKKVFYFKRYSDNPILEPTNKNPWESEAVFNPAAIKLNGKKHIIYRAMSKDNTSRLGYFSSKKGFKVDEKLDYPVYTPREPFEQKTRPNDFSGCEDPRLTKLGDNIYMTYTAYNGQDPRVALTSIKVDDFIQHNWRWEKPKAITASGVDNKNCVIFPEKINNKYVFLHRPDNKNIWIDFVENLEFKEKKWLGGEIILESREDTWDSLKVGSAGPPFKTKHGWILIYHGVSKTSRYYRLGAILLDLKNPKKILTRTETPLLSPRMPYEQKGKVSNVVFSCGSVLEGNKVLLYYGGADSVIGVATLPLKKLIKALYKE